MVNHPLGLAEEKAAAGEKIARAFALKHAHCHIFLQFIQVSTREVP